MRNAAVGRPQPPVKAHANDVDSSYARMPLAPADQVYAALDGARMKQIVEDITAISRKSRDEGIKYWGRIAGSKANGEMLEYTAKRFRGVRPAGRRACSTSTCRLSGSRSTGT